MTRTTSSDWIILRTASSRTLLLAAALNAAGFEAWTPVEVETKRVGRSRERIEHRTPLTPSFVLVRKEWLGELVAVERSPSQTYQAWDRDLRRMVVHGIPHFTIFRHLGEYPVVPDRALEPLRRAERSLKPLRAVRTFQPGEAVSYGDAGFEGLPGVVQELKGRFVVVLFPGLNIRSY